MEKTRLKRGPVVIPNKLYFRIGEVSDIVGVKPYVLRYWESEFPDIKPTKSKSGQRLYKRRDVEVLVKIKTLLYDERFTIDGARKRIKDIARSDTASEPEAIEEVKMQAKEPEPLEKQLDVFEETSPKKREAPKETSKVLMKIRKDLESLLEVVRG